MAIQNSVVLRNNMLDSRETTIGTSPKLRFYSGSVPANCAAARTGTLALDMSLPVDWMNAASGGTKTLAGSWAGVGAAGAGAGTVVGYYSIFDNAGSTCHEQGLLSVSVGSAWAATTAYTVGQRVSNGGNVYNCTTAGTSAGSGGPTGTGGSITDGSVVWAYVSVLGDMTLDNTSIATGQNVAITTYTLTAPGA